MTRTRHRSALRACLTLAALLAPAFDPSAALETKSKSKSCSGSRIMIDGRCIRKADASTHCGPGYRLKGNTCVQGYREPKSQKQRPQWQIDAIKKGCRPGMGWNPQEGCHEND